MFRPFRSLSICFCPFGLHLSITIGILLLFIIVTGRSQFDLYLLSFSSTPSTVNSPKFYLFFSWLKRVYFAVRVKDFNHFLSFGLRVQPSLPYTRMGEPLLAT
jgi:hypothetical protein